MNKHHYTKTDPVISTIQNVPHKKQPNKYSHATFVSYIRHSQKTNNYKLFF